MMEGLIRPMLGSIVFFARWMPRLAGVLLGLGAWADSFPHGWGGNGLGQVGNGTTSDATQPVAITSTARLRSLVVPSPN